MSTFNNPPAETERIGRDYAECTTCRRPKKPLGRSAPLGMYMCDQDCPGYREEPVPDHLWPGESRREFGYPRPHAEETEEES